VALGPRVGGYKVGKDRDEDAEWLLMVRWNDDLLQTAERGEELDRAWAAGWTFVHVYV